MPLTEDVLGPRAGASNRPDLLSVYGIAREVAALFDLELAPPPGTTRSGRGRRARSTSRSRTSTACPRYVGRLFRDATIGPSPVWLQGRARLRAGMRPISNVVDVTNYVMLALGNPLHAFDYAKLCAADGSSSAARRQGEELRTLDGVDRELEPVRPDDRRRRSARSRSRGSWAARRPRSRKRRRTILLEAANFEPYTIFRTSERLRLRTEGVEPLGEGRRSVSRRQQAANDGDASCIVELTGARAGSATRTCMQRLPERPLITYRPERADAVIGIATPPEEQHELLRTTRLRRGG